MGDNAEPKVHPGAELVENNPFNGSIQTVKISIIERTSYYPTISTNESYYLDITNNSVSIQAQTYTGFVRALESLFQLIVIESYGADVYACFIYNTPIHIFDDTPHQHRGVMLDTSRHFISKEGLKRVFDSMMYTKLNVFHWHLTDDDSFPLEIPEYPDLSRFGGYSPKEVYTTSDVKELIQYAATRGIRVIPEIDSPFHAYSWSFSPQFKDAVIKCNSTYLLDFSKQEVRDLVQKVWKHVLSLFPDEYVHVGFYNAIPECIESSGAELWKDMNNTQILNWYLQMVRNSTQGKTRVIWVGEGNNIILEDNEIIQFKGNQKSLNKTISKGVKNQFIYSDESHLSLSCGTGLEYSGKMSCPRYQTWKSISMFHIAHFRKAYGNQYLGAEVLMWGYALSDSSSVEIQLWPRGLYFAESLWNPDVTIPKVPRIVQMSKRIRERGVKCTPITTGYCESNPCIREYYT